jgi:hypothetical protein
MNVYWLVITESSEPLHVYIGGPNASSVTVAKELVDNLLETVRAKYRQFWLVALHFFFVNFFGLI